MKVQIIARTTSYVPEIWDNNEGGVSDAALLAEFAGRNCYQSFQKPNPATSTNEGYLANIIDHKHLSTFEHGAVTFLFTGISRALTHELCRHRHFSFSQLSQRYCPNTEGYVVPPLYQGDAEWQKQARELLDAMWGMLGNAYDMLVRDAQNDGVPRKQAREAARAVLPNATATQIVVSGNHRSWREFIQKRATVHADAEIRALAVEVFNQLRELEPALYQDGRLDVPESDPMGPQVVVWS